MQKLVWVPFFASKALDNTAWHVAAQLAEKELGIWPLYFIGKSSFLCQRLLQHPKNNHIKEIKLAFPVACWKKIKKLILAPLLTYRCSKIQSLNSNLRRHKDFPKGVMVEFFPLPHPTCSRANLSILGKYWEQTVIKPPWQDPLFCEWPISQLQSQNCCELGPAILASHHRLCTGLWSTHCHTRVEITFYHNEFLLCQVNYDTDKYYLKRTFLVWGQRRGLHV